MGTFLALVLLFTCAVLFVRAQQAPCPYDVFAWINSDVIADQNKFIQLPWDKITTVGFFGDADDNFRDFVHSLGKTLVMAASPSGIDMDNETQREMWINQQIEKVRSEGYDGLNIDYEGNDPSRTNGFNEVAVETCNSFHEQLPGSLISIDAPFYPEYEGRNYDYTRIADACDYLFVMAYDGEFWDNLQCAVSDVNCSMATSSIQMIDWGLQEYLDSGVEPSKIILGLPWYGLLYEYVLGVPFFNGQIRYADIQTVIASAGSSGNLSYVERGSVWRYQCNGPCINDNRATEIWFDDSFSLEPKFARAIHYGLRGVGMWEATYVDYSNAASDAVAMWDAACPAHL